jgi:hypothetical protein
MKKWLEVFLLVVGMITFAVISGLGGCSSKTIPTDAASSSAVQAKQANDFTPCPPPNQLCPCENNTPIGGDCMPSATPTPTFTPTPLATPTFTPTPNLSVCARCDIEFAQRRSEILNDTEDEIATGTEFCQNSCIGIIQCLEICETLDHLFAILKQAAELAIAVIEHNACLTDNNCP